MNGKIWNDTGLKAYVCAEEIQECRRVKLDANGKLVYADADALGIGVTTQYGNTGDTVTVALWSKPGTIPVAGSEAIAIGEVVYAAADGKVVNTHTAPATYIKVGENVGNYATSADGGVIELLATPDAGTELVVSA